MIVSELGHGGLCFDECVEQMDVYGRGEGNAAFAEVKGRMGD